MQYPSKMIQLVHHAQNKTYRQTSSDRTEWTEGMKMLVRLSSLSYGVPRVHPTTSQRHLDAFEK